MRKGEFKPGEIVPGTRYRVLGLLGVGGMGSVYEVEHTELGKRFVLKALLSELAQREDLVARLRNEQRALGRLEHPNIVTVTDAGVTSAEIPYFVMERLEGETLGARLKRHRRLPIVEALAVALGVLDGLAAAHEIGVVHRDIKPQNILLVGGTRPKILDFGVAKVADTGNAITARGVAVGTPRYMSPEQASGEAVDGRSDLYAVGLLLFEAIVGNGPFDDARDANEMLLAHLGRPVPRLSEHVAGITREFDEFVIGMLAKDPRSRPPTARAAAASLRVIALAYGPARESDARSLIAGHATHPFGVPVAARPPAPTTHADGVAARHGRRAEAPTDEANTLVRPGGAATQENTWIDDFGAQRTADATSPAASGPVTTPDHEFVRSGVTRTEILSAVAVPLPTGTEDTRTAVPITPNDGSRTLDPLPAAAPRQGLTRGARSLVVAALGVVVLSGGLLLLTASRGGSSPTTSATRSNANAEPVAAKTPELPAAPVAPPPSLPSVRSASAVTSAAAPGAASSPAPASPVAVVAPIPVAALARPVPRSSASASARTRPTVAPTTAKAAVAAMYPEAKSPISNKKSSNLPKLPVGLPGSGL